MKEIDSSFYGQLFILISAVITFIIYRYDIKLKNKKIIDSFALKNFQILMNTNNKEVINNYIKELELDGIVSSNVIMNINNMYKEKFVLR